MKVCDLTGKPLKHFYQWDEGRVIALENICGITEGCSISIDFGARQTPLSYPGTDITYSSGRAEVRVPDEILQQKNDLEIYVRTHLDEEIKTTDYALVRIIGRARPSNECVSTERNL